MWTTTLTRRRRAVPAVLLVAAAASAAVIMWRSSSSGVIVPTGAAMRPSTTVPEWFGRTDQAPRRIAGHVLVSGEPAIATVHVRLGLPDPRAWTGRDLLTDAAGAFDLGPLPAGPYQLLVTAPGIASRVYQVDTATTDGADLSLFAYACRPLSGRVVAVDARDSSEAAGVGLAGATVEVGGVEVAATDHDGNYSFCGPGEGTEAVIRASGRVSRWARLDTVMPRPEHTALALEEVLRGRVVDQFGFGVGGVTVEPCRLAYTDDPPNDDMAALAVTDADGIFELHEVAMGRNTFRLSQRGLADDDPEPRRSPTAR